MSAKCNICEVNLSSNPYDDEKLITYCEVCEIPLCIDHSIDYNGICPSCTYVIESDAIYGN